MTPVHRRSCQSGCAVVLLGAFCSLNALCASARLKFNLPVFFKLNYSVLYWNLLRTPAAELVSERLIMALFGIYKHCCGLGVDGIIVIVLLRGGCLVRVDLHDWSLHTTQVVSRSRSGLNLMFCIHLAMILARLLGVSEVVSPILGQKTALIRHLQNGWLPW